jgi:hypothetical protein
MKMFKFAAPVFLILLISTNLHSQTGKLRRVMLVHSSPLFTLQINANFNQGMGQLGGTYNADFQSDQFILGRSFGATKGYGVNIVTKMRLDEFGHLRLLASGFYNRMGSYIFTNLFSDKSKEADAGHSTINIFSLGFGIENNFTPNHKIKLLIGLQPLFSIINGTAKIWVSNIGIGSPYTYDVKIKNAFRIGGVLMGGVEYLMSEKVALNLGFNLIHANLLLKQAEDSGDPYNINLVDDESSPPIKYSGKKNIVILSINAGICFYWGEGPKRYVLSP